MKTKRLLTSCLVAMMSLLFATQMYGGEPEQFAVDGILYRWNGSWHKRDGVWIKEIYVCNNLGSDFYENHTEINIPSTVEYRGETFHVTAIDSYAFNHAWNLKKITIPESVTYIDKCYVESSAPIYKNPDNWHDDGFYIDNCLLKIRNKKECTEYKVREGTRLIAGNCFENCTLLRYVDMGTVRFVGPFAFAGCESLESFPMPNVKSIEWGAFCGCISLESISLPNAESLGESAFYGCKGLKNLDIPKVKKLGDRVFQNCTGLTSVTFPGEVDFINYLAFAGCSNLKEVTLPPTCERIGVYAFTDCISLEKVIVNYEEKFAINTWAFENCPSLKDLYFSGWVIRGLAGPVSETFSGMDLSQLTMHIPAEVLQYHNFAEEWPGIQLDAYYDGCEVNGIHYALRKGDGTATVMMEKKGVGNYSSLPEKVTIPKTIKNDEGDEYKVTGIADGALAFAPIKELVIEAEIEEIPEGAFTWADQLEKVTLPSTVRRINDDAFNSCAMLEQIPGLTDGNTELLPKLTYIGVSAFSECSKLQSVWLEHVTEIDEDAFYACTSLKRVTLGEQLAQIGPSAFHGCTALRRLEDKAITPQTFAESMLSGVDKSHFTIYVPAGRVNKYSMAEGWKDYTIAELGEERDGLYYIFYEESLTAIVVAETNDEDNYQSLAGKKVTVPATITKKGKEYAVTTIDELAFANAPIKEMVLQDKIITLCTHAFKNSSLEAIRIPESWNYTGRGLFENCSKLRSLVVPEGQWCVYDSIAFHCTSLESVVLPSSLKQIFKDAFSGCTNLGSITLPANVSEIQSRAFKGCTGLYEIHNLNKTPQTIDADVFEGLKLSNITLYVPTGAKAAYEAKDVWKEFTIKELNVVVDGLHYIINNSAYTATLTFDDIVNNYTGLSGKVTIPATITFNEETYQVTEIGNYAFQNNKTITELVLPEGIKEIGCDVINQATKIAKMNIPSTVNYIFRLGDGSPLISNDANYTDGMLYIDNCLLDAKTDLSGKITVKDGTRLIAGYTFYGCKEITEIVLPETVQEIGDYAFRSCKKLQGINIPEGITVLRRGTFGYCDDLGTYGHRLILPNSLVTVEREVFSGCYNLRGIIFPENVRSIGNLMFWDYSNPSQLQELVLPAGIQELKEFAFTGLGNLVFFYCFSENPEDIQLGDKVFSDMNDAATLYVPYGCKSKYEALDQWKDLKIEEMPVQFYGIYYATEDTYHTAAVTSEPGKSDPMYSFFEYSFFEETSLTIPAQIWTYNEGTQTYEVYTVNGMDDGAFSGAPFKTVRLPEGMKYLGAEVFSGSDLETVTLPSTINDLGTAFMECEHLKNVYCYRPDPIDISSDPFMYVDLSQATLYVPYGCADAYNAADGWNHFGTIREMAVCVDGYFFELDEIKKEATLTYQYQDEGNYEGLNSNQNYNVLSIPSSITVGGEEYAVTAVGAWAFAHYEGVRKLALPEGVRSIGEHAFEYTSIYEFIFPSTLTEISSSAFGDMKYMDIYIWAEKPIDMPSDWLEKDKNNVYLYVPHGRMEAYQAAEGWKNAYRFFELPVYVDGFYYELNDGKAWIARDYKYFKYPEIGWFNNYSELGKTVKIPASIIVDDTEYPVGGIAEYEVLVFADNKTMEELILPENEFPFEYYTFEECTSLRRITNPCPTPTNLYQVFRKMDLSEITLYVHHADMEAYQSASYWKNFKIEPIETPIMVAGQSVRPEQYGKSLTGDGITGEVVVTEGKVTLGDGASVKTDELNVPAIEFFGDNDTHFTISGKNAILSGGKNPAVRINGDVTINFNSGKDESLEIRSECADGAVALADEAKADINLNIGESTNNRIKILSTYSGIGVPQKAYCYIQAGGYVDIIVSGYECPIGYTNRALSLKNTYMVQPFGGEVTEDGVFDAFGNEVYCLRLAPETNQNGKAYPVELNGVTVTEGNAADILGDGKSSYDAETNTLTLNGANYDGKNGQVLRALEGLNLKVVGKNTLSSGSEQPCIEVKGGDFIIFGDKDAELTVSGNNGIQSDKSQLYRMEVKRCKVDITALGEHNKWALQTDSLCVNAGTLRMETKSGDDDAVAWMSWNSSKSGGLVLEHALLKKGTVNVDKEMSIEPVPSYTVTFTDKDDKTLKEQEVFEGEAATAPEAPVVEGYKFIGWDGFFNEVNADITVKAVYEINYYNVTFKNWDGTVVFSQVVAWGTEADTPKKPYREGYTFTGWDKDYTAVKEDLVVTAQYEINKYTVTFFGNGGVELSKQTVDWNTAAVAPDAPAVEGYTFKGWDTDFSQVTKDLEVTAQYEINKFTVTFVDWDGTELSKQTIDWDGAAIYPSDPKREGYTFKGWDKAIDHVKADLTVTAQYEINTYTVTFYDREGKVISTQTVKWNEAAETPETPAWDGHTFTAWDTDFEHVKADLDIKPVYDTILYTVKFVDWNGNELKAEKVEYGQSATAPVNPVRDGYTFIGWDGFFNEVTADITVKAQYEINTYTVRFYDREDNVISTQTVEWNEAAKEPELETWEGHLFTGWSAEFSHVKSDLDIKPIYDVNTYKVTFIGFDGETALKTENVEYGMDAMAPEAPEVEGYTFIGWDKAYDNVTADLVVTAIYEAIDYTPQNLKAVVSPKEDDVQITLSWDKVEGAASYELRVSTNGNELFLQNTESLNVISALLSDIERQYSLAPGTYTIDWQVRSLNNKDVAVSGWVDGPQFDITVKDNATGTEDVQSGNSSATKVLRNGVLYILRNGKMYETSGKVIR